MFWVSFSTNDEEKCLKHCQSVHLARKIKCEVKTVPEEEEWEDEEWEEEEWEEEEW